VAGRSIRGVLYWQARGRRIHLTPKGGICEEASCRSLVARLGLLLQERMSFMRTVLSKFLWPEARPAAPKTCFSRHLSGERPGQASQAARKKGCVHYLLLFTFRERMKIMDIILHCCL
jgi:hypothetical protein